MFDFFITCANINLEGEGMEKINTETLLTTLFEYGFDKIDPVLYALVLEKAVLDNTNKGDFEFIIDEPISDVFKYHVSKIGSVYKLKELTYEKLHNRWYYYHSNAKLLEYFNNLDFTEIITKKLEGYGYNKIDYILGKHKVDNNVFCEKELEIIDKMINKDKKALFGITEEITKKREIMEEIISNNDYIDWLLVFAQTHNNLFYDDDSDYLSDRIADKDKKNLKKLSIFFELISEYAEQHSCNDGYFCKIKYCDEVINIGVLHGQQVIHYASIAPKTDEHGKPKPDYDLDATDYSQIVECYKKYNKQKKLD